MDFQTVAAFLDVVKNPDKYSAALAQFDEREKRWKELVEAHTKLTEVDKYVEKRQKEADKQANKAEALVKDAETKLAKAKIDVEELLKDAEQRRAEAVKLEAETSAALAYAKQQVEKNRQLEEALSWEREQTFKTQVEADAIRSELNEKLQKLKAIAS